MIGVGLGSYKNFKALDKGKLKKVIGRVIYGTKRLGPILLILIT